MELSEQAPLTKSDLRSALSKRRFLEKVVRWVHSAHMLGTTALLLMTMGTPRMWKPLT